MKKSLCCMLFLFLLSCVSLGTAHRMVSASKDEVQVIETWYQGDSTAAADLQLTFIYEEAQQLVWDIVFSPTQSTQAQFQFYPQPISHVPDSDPSSKLSFAQNWIGGISYPSPRELPTADELPLAPLYHAVSEHTQAGHTHSEFLTLRDYCDTYPLDIQFRTNHTLYSRDYLESLCNSMSDIASISEEERAQPLRALHFLNAIQEAFRFPVPADHQLYVTVSKDEDGRILQLDAHEAPQSPNSLLYGEEPDVSMGSTLIPAHVDFTSFSVSTDTDLYFIPEARRADGALLDYRLTPGGYGVYRMPMQGDLPMADQLECVCPLQPEQHVESFQLDDHGARLLLTTRTDTQVTLYLLDAETGLQRQAFSAEFPAVGTQWTPIFHQDNLLALFPNGTLQLYVQDEAGDYHHALSGKLPQLTIPWENDYTMVYHDDRFALALQYPFQVDPNCSLILLIWDQEHLLYTGTFTTSLRQTYPASVVQGPPIIPDAPSIHFISSENADHFNEEMSS